MKTRRPTEEEIEDARLEAAMERADRRRACEISPEEEYRQFLLRDERERDRMIDGMDARADAERRLVWPLVEDCGDDEDDTEDEG